MEWTKNSKEGKGKDYCTVSDIFIYPGMAQLSSLSSQKTKFMARAVDFKIKMDLFIGFNFHLETASDYGGVKQLKLDWWTSALQARGVKHIGAKNHPSFDT